MAAIHNRIEQLRSNGYTKSEILKLTGCTVGVYEHYMRKNRWAKCSELENAARSLLHKVPNWWSRSEEDWKRVVRANFADVLVNQ